MNNEEKILSLLVEMKTKQDKMEKDLSLSIAKQEKMEKDLSLSIAKQDKMEKDLSLSIAKQEKMEKDLSLSIAKQDKMEKDLSLSIAKQDKMEQRIEGLEDEFKKLFGYLAKRNEEINAKFASIDEKLDNMATKEDLKEVKEVLNDMPTVKKILMSHEWVLQKEGLK